MKDPKRIARMWRAMRGLWIALIILVLASLVINFIVADGQMFALKDLMELTAILLLTTFVVWSCRRRFNVMAGSEICKWRSPR